MAGEANLGDVYRSAPDDGGDEADDKGGKEFLHIVVPGVVDIAKHKTEVHSECKHYEKTKNYFFKIYRLAPGGWVECCVGREYQK